MIGMRQIEAQNLGSKLMCSRVELNIRARKVNAQSRVREVRYDEVKVEKLRYVTSGHDVNVVFRCEVQTVGIYQIPS